MTASDMYFIFMPGLIWDREDSTYFSIRDGKNVALQAWRGILGLPAKLLIIGMPLGILREPSAQHAFFLKEHLVNSPEAGECETSDDGGKDVILDDERQCA